MIDFITGVFAGIAGSAVVWLARRAIGVALSALQSALWTGRNVSGKWKADYVKDDARVSEQAVLHQLGHSVWGKIENHPLNLSYEVRGTLRAGTDARDQAPGIP